MVRMMMKMNLLHDNNVPDYDGDDDDEEEEECCYKSTR